MTKPLASLEPTAAAKGIHTSHPRTPLDQWHLWRQVVALEHLNWFVIAAETHVLGATVSVVPQQPERTHER